MLGVSAILVALALLIYLAFRGFTLLLLAPAMAMLAAALAAVCPCLVATRKSS